MPRAAGPVIWYTGEVISLLDRGLARRDRHRRDGQLSLKIMGAI
jgi:hypothetical protein